MGLTSEDLTSLETLAEQESTSAAMDSAPGLGFPQAELDPAWNKDVPYETGTADHAPWISSQEVVHEISQAIHQLPSNASHTKVLSRDQSSSQ